MPPYGSALRRDHYARSAAHPTVRVDGQDQAETSGRLLAWSITSEVTRAVVSAPGAFDGVELHRHLVMHDDLLLDAVHVRADEARDLVLGLRPADRLDAHEEDGLFFTTWRDGGAVAPGEAGPRPRGLPRQLHRQRLRLGPGARPLRRPRAGPDRDRLVLAQRRDWFVSAYQPTSDPTRARPRLRIVSITDHGIELEATTGDGRSLTVHLDPERRNRP